jgi:hypothetical protein
MFRQRFFRTQIGMVGILSGLLCLLEIQLQSAHAESPAAMLHLPEPSAFYEAFLDQPPQFRSPGSIVGVTIVGIRFDGPVTPFNPAILRVRVGDSAARSEGRLCLRVISRDGRYFARSQYNVGSGTEPMPLVEYHTAYGKILADYSNRDVAVSVFKSINCNDQTNAEFVAAQLTPNVTANELLVQIRAGEARVRAQLVRDNTPVTQQVLCTRLETGPTVGFSSQCAIKLPAGFKSGRYDLSIGETASTGEIKVTTYSIFLWLGM